MKKTTALSALAGLIGIGLLIYWAFTVVSYGIYVDENSLQGDYRLEHLLVFAAGVLFAVLALVVPIVARKRLERR